MQRQPLIDEMVAFLEQEQPAAIEKIRNDNPSFSDLLKTGSMLGESDDSDELKIRATVCFSATDVIIRKCDEELPKLKARLKGSQKLQLFGQILTAVSGASVITTLATNHKTITYIAGSLSLLGSLIPLVVESQNRSLNRNKQVEDTYAELTRMKLEAGRNNTELKFFIENNFNIKGISEVINRSNQLCSDITALMLLY